jgi:hypothetical protein
LRPLLRCLLHLVALRVRSPKFQTLNKLRTLLDEALIFSSGQPIKAANVPGPTEPPIRSEPYVRRCQCYAYCVEERNYLPMKSVAYFQSFSRCATARPFFFRQSASHLQKPQSLVKGLPHFCMAIVGRSPTGLHLPVFFSQMSVRQIRQCKLRYVDGLATGRRPEDSDVPSWHRCTSANKGQQQAVTGYGTPRSAFVVPLYCTMGLATVD